MTTSAIEIGDFFVAGYGLQPSPAHHIHWLVPVGELVSAGGTGTLFDVTAPGIGEFVEPGIFSFELRSQPARTATVSIMMARAIIFVFIFFINEEFNFTKRLRTIGGWLNVRQPPAEPLQRDAGAGLSRNGASIAAARP